MPAKLLLLSLDMTYSSSVQRKVGTNIPGATEQQDCGPPNPFSARLVTVSSRNGASKDCHHAFKESSDCSCSLSSKQKTHCSNYPSSSSQQPCKQSSSSILVNDSTAERASSLGPSQATAIASSLIDTNQSFNPESFSRSGSMQTDLLSVSAWTDSHERSHHHQDLPYHSDDSTKTSICLQHASMGLEYHSVEEGRGLAPLERWLNGSLGEGCVVALQLGDQQLRECTCILIQDDVGEVAVNGTQPSVSPHN